MISFSVLPSPVALWLLKSNLFSIIGTEYGEGVEACADVRLSSSPRSCKAFFVMKIDELGEGGDLGILIENNASKCAHLHFLKSSEGSKNWESKMK